MLEYEPVYKLLAKYEYDVDEDARAPGITAPAVLTRDGVPVVRARTARLLDVVRFAALLRADTPRVDVFVVRVGVIERDETLRVPTPRDVAVFVPVCVTAPGVRTLVERVVFTRDVVVERGLIRPETRPELVAETTGSANTERIEITVEHTKNAAANKNTVPTAFLQEFTFIRILIKISCRLSYETTPRFSGFFIQYSFT